MGVGQIFLGIGQGGFGVGQVFLGIGQGGFGVGQVLLGLCQGGVGAGQLSGQGFVFLAFRRQGILGGFEVGFQLGDPAVQPGLFLPGSRLGAAQFLIQRSDLAFQTLGIALGLGQIAAQRFGVRLQSGDFLAGSRQISLQAADLAVQALLLRLRFGIGVVQLLRQGGGTGFQRGRFVFGIIQGALE